MSKNIQDKKGSPRECVATNVFPACRKQISNKQPPSEPIELELTFWRFQARSRLRKCAEYSKNQERIFIKNDFVDVLMNFNPENYDGNVWFLVTKVKNGSKKLWKRKWSELKDKISLAPGAVLTRNYPVVQVGYVSDDTTWKQYYTAPKTLCYCVRLDPTSDATDIWVEKSCSPYVATTAPAAALSTPTTLTLRSPQLPSLGTPFIPQLQQPQMSIPSAITTTAARRDDVRPLMCNQAGNVTSLSLPIQQQNQEMQTQRQDVTTTTTLPSLLPSFSQDITNNVGNNLFGDFGRDFFRADVNMDEFNMANDVINNNNSITGIGTINGLSNYMDLLDFQKFEEEEEEEEEEESKVAVMEKLGGYGSEPMLNGMSGGFCGVQSIRESPNSYNLPDDPAVFEDTGMMLGGMCYGAEDYEYPLFDESQQQHNNNGSIFNNNISNQHQ